MAALVLAGLFQTPAALAQPTATIAGAFGDSCRNFEAHSTKDISHVQIHYADGRMVTDETVESPDFWLDGDPGDEMSLVVVKSGLTREPFSCTQPNAPPTAVLELAITSTCAVVRDEPPLMHCPSATERTEWTSFDGTVVFLFGDLCVSDPTLCEFPLRGTGSIDDDNDLASWALDFGDGSSATGDWTTNPPVDLVLTLPGCNRFSDVTLTVTDSAGHSDSDTMRVATGNCED